MTAAGQSHGHRGWVERRRNLKSALQVDQYSEEEKKGEARQGPVRSRQGGGRGATEATRGAWKSLEGGASRGHPTRGRCGSFTWPQGQELRDWGRVAVVTMKQRLL